MNQSLIEAFANEMAGIFREHRLNRATDAEIHSLSLDEAYEVQERYLASRIANGERPAGYKVGCTSPQIRKQFGLTEPICARLMAPRIYPNGTKLNFGDYFDCALEPELVLHIGSELDGSNLETSHLLQAIAAISPGIEVHNYRFWYGRPTSQELIASNGIHAGIVVGQEYKLAPDVELSQEQTALYLNGIEMASGIGSEIMGGPIESVRWLLSHLRKRGRGLRSGDLVIPGSATKLVEVKAGDFAESRFTHFGSCRAYF